MSKRPRASGWRLSLRVTLRVVISAFFVVSIAVYFVRQSHDQGGRARAAVRLRGAQGGMLHSFGGAPEYVELEGEPPAALGAECQHATRSESASVRIGLLDSDSADSDWCTALRRLQHARPVALSGELIAASARLPSSNSVRASYASAALAIAARTIHTGQGIEAARGTTDFAAQQAIELLAVAMRIDCGIAESLVELPSDPLWAQVRSRITRAIRFAVDLGCGSALESLRRRVLRACRTSMRYSLSESSRWGPSSHLVGLLADLMGTEDVECTILLVETAGPRVLPVARPHEWLPTRLVPAIAAAAMRAQPHETAHLTAVVSSWLEREPQEQRRRVFLRQLVRQLNARTLTRAQAVEWRLIPVATDRERELLSHTAHVEDAVLQKGND